MHKKRRRSRLERSNNRGTDTSQDKVEDSNDIQSESQHVESSTNEKLSSNKEKRSEKLPFSEEISSHHEDEPNIVNVNNQFETIDSKIEPDEDIELISAKIESSETHSVEKLWVKEDTKNIDLEQGEIKHTDNQSESEHDIETPKHNQTFGNLAGNLSNEASHKNCSTLEIEDIEALKKMEGRGSNNANEEIKDSKLNSSSDTRIQALEQPAQPQRNNNDDLALNEEMKNQDIYDDTYFRLEKKNSIETSQQPQDEKENSSDEHQPDLLSINFTLENNDKNNKRIKKIYSVNEFDHL